MNLTFRDILGFNSNSQKLFSEKMPLTCAYKLSKIQKILADEIEFYQKKYLEIIEEYGKKDENGKLMYSNDGQVVLLKEDKISEAQSKIDELHNMTVDLNVDPYLLELSDFDENKKVSMEEMIGLLPFIK